MRPYPLFCFTLLGALMCSTAAAAPSFDAPVNISATTGGAIGSVAGDLNLDGRVEFVSAASRSSNDAHLRIYQWDEASNGFFVMNVYDPSSRQDRFGGDLAIADLNNDGWPDIVVPESNNSNGSGKVSWFENPHGNLTGAWTEHVITTWTGSGANSVEHMSEIDTGDIDGNGWIDVVTRDVSHGFSIMLRQDGGTGWQPRIDVAANPREGLELWNPDGDGDLDVLLNGAWFETPSNPQSGTFTRHPIKGAEAWYPIGNSSNEQRDYACQITLGDFNEDGRMDFVITNSEELNNAASTDSKPKGIQVFLAPPDPINDTWTMLVLHPQYFSWHSCEVGDVDGDGATDFEEWLANTNPANANSVFRVLGTTTETGHTLMLHWTAEAGRQYTLWHSADLIHFTPLSTVPASPPSQSMETEIPATPTFFQISVSR